jgi:hypothetical protein
MPSIEFEGLEVSVYRSERDNFLIVDITGPKEKDLDEDGAPKIRVNLNEETLFEHPLSADYEPLVAVMLGNLTEGFTAIGPFEDYDEAQKHCFSRAFIHSTWIIPLNSPHAEEKNFVR